MKQVVNEAGIYAENTVPIDSNGITRGWIVETIEAAYIEGVRRGLRLGRNALANAGMELDSDEIRLPKRKTQK